MSLAALGNKSDACGTYIELLRRYPDAAATVMQRAKQERQRLTCP
jgi:TolA-binding protein